MFKRPRPPRQILTEAALEMTEEQLCQFIFELVVQDIGVSPENVRKLGQRLERHVWDRTG